MKRHQPKISISHTIGKNFQTRFLKKQIYTGATHTEFKRTKPYYSLFLASLIVNVVLTTNAFSQPVTTGLLHSFAVCSDNTVMSWGGNGSGPLGDGTTTNRLSPVPVSGLTDVVTIYAGWFHSLFLKNDGTVWACGQNTYGQLGDGTTTDRTTPVQVSGLTGIIAISGGFGHSLFLKNDGTAWACGWNSVGQIGDGTNTDRSVPVQVSGLTNIISVAAGHIHSVFLKNDGTVWGCGDNGYWQLGDGTTVDRNVSVSVSGLNNVSSISAGFAYSLFLKNDATAWSIGYNVNGQLGDGTTTDRSSPVLVSGLTDIIKICCGVYHSVFLKNDGTAWTCGTNVWGELGDGTTIERHSPVQVSGLTGISAIGAGYPTVFVKNDGTVWACGLNALGALGDGTTTDRSLPVQTLGLCQSVVLPIELISFSVICDNQKNNITWSTASELNNDYFDIEKSEDGLNFEILGTVDGKNGNEIVNYSYNDTKLSQGITYYRLKQTDNNGDFKYSNVIYSVCNEGMNIINISQNTINKTLTYSINNSKTSQVYLKIYNILGQIILMESYNIEKGYSNHEIDISFLKNSSYYLELETLNKEHNTKKLFIVN